MVDESLIALSPINALGIIPYFSFSNLFSFFRVVLHTYCSQQVQVC